MHPHLGKWSNLTSIFFQMGGQPPTSISYGNHLCFNIDPFCLQAKVAWGSNAIIELHKRTNSRSTQSTMSKIPVNCCKNHVLLFMVAVFLLIVLFQFVVCWFLMVILFYNCCSWCSHCFCSCCSSSSLASLYFSMNDFNKFSRASC